MGGGDAQLMSDRGATDRRVTTSDSDCLMLGLIDTNNPMRRGGVMQERRCQLGMKMNRTQVHARPIMAETVRRAKQKKECQRRRGPNRKSMGPASWLGRNKWVGGCDDSSKSANGPVIMRPTGRSPLQCNLQEVKKQAGMGDDAGDEVVEKERRRGERERSRREYGEERRGGGGGGRPSHKSPKTKERKCPSRLST